MEEYINGFEGITKDRLKEVYALIKPLLPDAKEKISYGIPTFYNEKGQIVYFAGYKDFVSVYPVHQAKSIAEELRPYLSGKSTARFSNSEPLPRRLIKDIVTELARVNETRDKPE